MPQSSPVSPAKHYILSDRKTREILTFSISVNAEARYSVNKVEYLE